MRVSELKVGVIINTSSGGYDLECEHKMLDILRTSGITEAEIWCGDAHQMERSFTEATDQKLGLLVVLGGDGTIRTAAETCGAERPYLIPLPGGTMNMLARALYGDLSWEDALKKTLTAPSAMVLSGGRVAGKQFFIAAIVGAPTLWTEARESIREQDIGKTIENGTVAFQSMFEMKMQYSMSAGMKGEAEAVAVICPLISEKMSDSEQALEAAAIEVDNVAEVIGLLTAVAFGKWRDERNIILTKTNQVCVQSSKDIPGILDGEKVNLRRSAEINFVSKAVTVLVSGPVMTCVDSLGESSLQRNAVIAVSLGRC
jgi:diacylglycerol kinase family enzyme